MLNRTLDFLFIDSFAFAINATLGAIVKTKLCNYSWEGETNYPVEKENDVSRPADSHLSQPEDRVKLDEFN